MKKPKKEKRIIHIDMDAYFASVEQADNPNLIGKPVIVCGNPKSRSVVSACSYEARKYGINSGMSVIEALSLCPSLISIPTNHSRYIEVSKKIFNCIRSFTEEMEIYSIDEVFIDVTDIINLYRGVKNLCVEIKKKIQRDTALPSSCGAGPNKLISKIASSYAKPDGIKIVETSEIDNFMRTLPIEKVPGIGVKSAEKLHKIGIENCGEIKKIGLDFFVKQFGNFGKTIYFSACGVDTSPVITQPDEAKTISNSHTLSKDTLNRDTIDKVLFKLSENVAGKMRQENFHGNYCSILVRFEDFTETGRRRQYNDIPADGKKIFSLVKEILTEFKLNKKVRMLGVTVGKLLHSDFNYLFPEKREKVFFVADKINEKFGENTLIPAAFLLLKDKKP